MFYTKPNLRNFVYVVTICLAFYILFLTTASKEIFSYLPGYLKPDLHQQPIPTADRAERVRAAFLHAYHGYEKYAAPYDELRPKTRVGSNHYNGWGVTAFDALDTMLLMGLKDEYHRALGIIERANFNRTTKQQIPYFETVIRYLGGLLSAYAISADPLLLNRAEELAAQLDPVFNTTSGLARFSVDPITGKPFGPDFGILAEFASLQLEYTYLAKLTGNPRYLNRSENIMNIFENANLTDTGGMLPVGWDLKTGQPLDAHLSVGAQADSAHEYLLKLFLLTGKTDKRSVIMYLRATTQIITQLLYLSPKRHLLYVTDTYSSIYNYNGSPSHVFEHLSCFLPGLFALGANTIPLDNLDSLGIKLEHLGNVTMYGNGGKAYRRLSRYNLKELHMWAAEGIAQTCYLTYADSATGLGPDEVTIMDGSHRKTKQEENEMGRRWIEPDSHLWIDVLDRWKWSGSKGVVPGLETKAPVVYSKAERLSWKSKSRDYTMRKTNYLLRPETVESLYTLWKTTGDTKWREWGWDIFEAIERVTKTSAGYTFVEHVDRTSPPLGDAMPSFFLAETLKYLYLMFLENDPISFDKWVFNTEAHPFPVFQWTEEEKNRFSLH